MAPKAPRAVLSTVLHHLGCKQCKCAGRADIGGIPQRLPRRKNLRCPWESLQRLTDTIDHALIQDLEDGVARVVRGILEHNVPREEDEQIAPEADREQKKVGHTSSHHHAA